MRPIDLIVIHCSASPNGRWTTVQDIDAWHAARGFKRYADPPLNPLLTAIGYHFVIYTNGALATGRDVSEIGAHVQGYNQRSLGLCMVGTDRFSQAQWDQLAAQVKHLAAIYNVPLISPNFKGANPRGICGHNEVPAVTKACPGFSVGMWLSNGMKPLADNLREG